MASWQLSFEIIPKGSLEDDLGFVPEFIQIVRPCEGQTLDDLRKIVARRPKYWVGRTQEIGCFETLLPIGRSWSAEASMYGNEDGDFIEIWRRESQVERITIRYSLIEINREFITESLKIVEAAKCVLHSHGTGNIIEPSLNAFNGEVKRHKPSGYVEDWKPLV